MNVPSSAWNMALNVERCESCHMRPWTELVVIGDEPFVICETCVPIAELAAQ